MRETKIKKKLDTELKTISEKILKEKIILQTKKEKAFDAHRKMDALQYELVMLLKTNDYTTWPQMLCNIYNKYSNAKTKINIPDQFYTRAPEEREKMIEEKTENNRIQAELAKQRDCVTNKIYEENKKTLSLEKIKHDLVMDIEKENNILIDDCNEIREEGREIVKRVGILEKKFKEITGVSLKNIETVESELVKLLCDTQPPPKTSRTLTNYEKIKERPKPGRVQNLIAFYDKYANRKKSVG